MDVPEPGYANFSSATCISNTISTTGVCSALRETLASGLPYGYQHVSDIQVVNVFVENELAHTAAING